MKSRPVRSYFFLIFLQPLPSRRLDRLNSKQRTSTLQLQGPRRQAVEQVRPGREVHGAIIRHEGKSWLRRCSRDNSYRRRFKALPPLPIAGKYRFHVFSAVPFALGHLGSLSPHRRRRLLGLEISLPL